MYKGLQNHISKKKRQRNTKKNTQIFLKLMFKIGFYALTLYALEYHFQVSLFLKLGILFGIHMYFLQKININ